MSRLVKNLRENRIRLLLALLPLAFLVFGLPLIDFNQQASACNTPITVAEALSDEQGKPLAHANGSETSVNAGDSSITITVPDGGTATAIINGVAANVTRIGNEVKVDLPDTTSGTYIMVFKYIDSNGRECEWMVVITRKDGPDGKSDCGGHRTSMAGDDTVFSPIPTVGCSGYSNQLLRCGKHPTGTSNPTGGVDTVGGENELGSLHFEMPLAVFPNEPGLDSGNLLLSLTTPGDNAANAAHLMYVSPATMKITSQQTTGLPAGVVFRCDIRQASGYPVSFELKSGETIGRPWGNNTDSGARIELLDSSNAATSNPAGAVAIRQYRASGSVVKLDMSSGDVVEFSTRQGRVTTFPHSDFELIYASGTTTLRQIRTAAGLLDIVTAETANDDRRYTVSVYAPGQFDAEKEGGIFTVKDGESPRRTVLIASPATTPEITNITVSHGTRSHTSQWKYEHGSLYHVWSKTEAGVLRQSKRVDYTPAGGRTTTYKWADLSEGGDEQIFKSKVYASPVQWGGYRYNGSTVWETSESTDATAVARTYQFYTDSGSAGSYGKIKSHTLATGATYSYKYDSDGRMTERKSPWLDDVDGKVETYSYTRLEAPSGMTATTLDLGDYRPRKTTVKFDGVVGRVRYFESFTDNATGEYVEISEIAATPGAAFGGAANLRTVRRYYAPGADAASRGRLASVVRPGGAGTKYTYSAGTTYTSAFTATVEDSLNSSLAVMPAFSAKTVTVYDSRGDMRGKTSSACPRGASGYTDVGKVECSYDSKGYKDKETETSLPGNRTHILADYTWSNGRLTGMIDATGVSYAYEYDDFGRRTTTTRGAIAAGNGCEAQLAITTTIAGTQRRSGLSVGWQDETVTTSAGGITLTRATGRDERGRVDSLTDENGYTTAHDINSTGTVTATTHSNGALMTHKRFIDGRFKSSEGTAAVNSYAAYVVETGGDLVSTRRQATSNDVRCRTTTVNMLGQTTDTVHPALNGVTATTVTVTSHYEDGTGLPVRISSTAADTPHTIMEYNDIGIVTRRGLSGDDEPLTLAGTDRITDIETGVENIGGTLYSVNKTTIHPTSESSKLIAATRSQINNFTGNVIACRESDNIRGETTIGKTELSLGTEGAPTGITTSTVDSPAMGADSVTVAYYGRIEIVSVPGVSGDTTYAYDALGRAIHVKDPRHPTGADADTLYVSGKNLVCSTANAAGDTTSFEYYADGVTGAGRVKTTTLADHTSQNPSKIYNIFDARGNLLARWGSQTYPKMYEYTVYDEMKALHTWRAEPGLTLGTTSIPDDSAETGWTRDSATGLLLTKTYPDNRTWDYTYDTANRPKTRKWSREISTGNRVTTTYAYTAWGELDTTTHSNDPSATRPLDFDYDRLGRIDLVTQTGTLDTPGTNTHDFEYDDYDLMIDTETVTLENSGISRVIKHTRDVHLRPTRHRLWTTDTVPVAEHEVNFDYRPADSRLWTVTDNELFTYDYESANNRLVKTLAGPHHLVTNIWETSRDILDAKKNKETAGGTYPSSFDYTVNNIGQRTRVGPVMGDGTPVVPVSTYSVVWGWDYTDRGELESADYGDDDQADDEDRSYTYDRIGNRLTSADETGTTNYYDAPGTGHSPGANALNQYGEIDYPAPAPTAHPVHDYDGNMESGPLHAIAADGTSALYTGTLVWNAENRLVEVHDNKGTSDQMDDILIAKYAYDYLGRRISKTVGTATTHYIYDGWNLIAEYAGATLEKTYTWGMDLSGTMQGAGGVGGLLSVSEHDASTGAITATYYPTYDGNGNVSEYLKMIEDDPATNDIDEFAVVVVAHYEYDPFGNTLIASGDMAAVFHHRFSTKYLDPETGLYYYGYRYYGPKTGRWMSLDPIGERGGANLYGFVGNDGVNRMDVLGLRPPPHTIGWPIPLPPDPISSDSSATSSRGCKKGDIDVMEFIVTIERMIGSPIKISNKSWVYKAWDETWGHFDGKVMNCAEMEGGISKKLAGVRGAIGAVAKIVKSADLVTELFATTGGHFSFVMRAEARCCICEESEDGDITWKWSEPKKTSPVDSPNHYNYRNPESMVVFPDDFANTAWIVAENVVDMCCDKD